MINFYATAQSDQPPVGIYEFVCTITYEVTGNSYVAYWNGNENNPSTNALVGGIPVSFFDPAACNPS